MTDNPTPNDIALLREACDYLIDSYRRLWKGGVVRDLAEAEAAWSHAKAALAPGQHDGAAIPTGDMNDYMEAIDASRPRLKPSTEQAGYVLVPREPTRAVCEAIEAAMAKGRSDRAWIDAVDAATPSGAGDRL